MSENQERFEIIDTNEFLKCRLQKTMQIMNLVMEVIEVDQYLINDYD